MESIKIIICDDHPLITEGLRSFIEPKETMKILAVAHSVAQLWEVLKIHTADILLLDISLPDGSGIEVCQEVKKKYPEMKIIALSNHNERSFILKMLGNQASGYLVKSSSVGDLERAIEEVYRGEIFLGREAQRILTSLAQSEMQEIPPITKREKEVLQYIIEGFSSVQIAEKMFISPQTVDSHRKNLMAKFGVNKTINLIQKVKELGLF